MRKKDTIRLNESMLKRIIKESVKRVLKENEFLDDMEYMDDIKNLYDSEYYDSEYMDDGDLEPQAHKITPKTWSESHYGFYPYITHNSGKGNKKADNAASWEYFDRIRDGVRDSMARKAKTIQSMRTGKPTMIDKEVKQDWINSRHLPRIGGTYYGFPTAYDDFKKELDKRWENQIEAEKYEKKADTRPLHRKGSLNRELDKKNRR